MLSRLLILTILLINFSLHAQFIKIDVNTAGINGMSNTKQAGDNDMVAIISGELYHITRNADSVFQVRLIENSLPDIRNFVMHDIDRDGDKDIICYQNLIGIFHVYLKVDGKYQYY